MRRACTCKRRKRPEMNVDGTLLLCQRCFGYCVIGRVADPDPGEIHEIALTFDLALDEFQAFAKDGLHKLIVEDQRILHAETVVNAAVGALADIQERLAAGSRVTDGEIAVLVTSLGDIRRPLQTAAIEHSRRAQRLWMLAYGERKETPTLDAIRRAIL